MRHATAIGGIALLALAVVATMPGDARADNNKKVFVEAGDDGVEMVWIQLSDRQISAIEAADDAEKPTALSRIQRAVLKRALGGSASDYKWVVVQLRVSSEQLQQRGEDSYVVRPKSAFVAKKTKSRFDE